jgi:hypothetical protein
MSAGSRDALHAIVAGGSGCTTGACVSATVIFCTALAVALQPSTAVHVRRTVKLPLHPPGVTSSAKLMVVQQSAQPPAAVALPVTFGVVAAPHSSVRDGGGVTTSGGLHT